MGHFCEGELQPHNEARGGLEWTKQLRSTLGIVDYMPTQKENVKN